MKEKNRYFLLLSAAVAALGGLLFGFDTAVISGTIPFIQPYFGLDELKLGWTVSSLLAGCIVGVLSAGKPGDVFGRKRTLMFAASLFLISALGSALSTQHLMFIIFRFIGGFAVGAASMLSPMYISEISPAARRGQLVSLNQMAIVVGILLAFFSNYWLADAGINNWRWMFAVMGIPAILFLVTLFFVPESPRWLVQKGRDKEAFNILGRINGSQIARTELADIQESILEEKGTYREVFSPAMRPVLWLGILLAVFSQVTGINTIMYYAPIIFKETGIGVNSALLQTAIVGSVNFLFTVVAIAWVDKVGRKPLLIFGSLGLAVSLTALSLAFYLHQTNGIIILAFVLLYIASYAASLGPITWVAVSEIFPNKLRSRAMSVAVVALWAANFIVILFFPIMLKRWGGGTTFLIFDLMCFALILFVYFKFPETKGKSLEELSKILVRKKHQVEVTGKQ
jgi:SP family arabinose:H+ symporter-like MFS transporter